MNKEVLPRRVPSDFLAQGRAGIPSEIRREAEVIVGEVRSGGEEAVRGYATRFGERDPEQSLYVTRDELHHHLEALDPSDRVRLERIAERIRSFAEAQRDALTGLTCGFPVEGSVTVSIRWSRPDATLRVGVTHFRHRYS